MELFKNTNFDFLGLKWPFIGASLVLTAAGLISLAIKGGPRYGIDFNGGAQIDVRFASEPPVQKIREAISSRISGGNSVQQISNNPEVEITTEIKDEKELNANRQLVEDTLRTMFGDPGGKLDLNNASADQLANALRDPLLQAGVAISEQQLQDTVKAIQAYRNANGGIVKSYDELA